jgi:hypothetical protein
MVGELFHFSGFRTLTSLLPLVTSLLGLGRDAVLHEVLDKLPATVLALVVLFAIVDVAIFLVLGRLTPGTHVSDHHGFLLTSAGWVSVWGQQ